MLDKLAEEISQRTKIICDPRSILRVLDAARKSDNIWMIATLAHEPLVLVAEIIRVLADRGILSISKDAISLNSQAIRILEDYGYVEGDHRCECCGGRGVVIDRLPIDVINGYMKAVLRRPKPVQEYDQGFVTYDSALARVAIMDQYGDIRGRRILLIGDDDLLSIAIGLLGRARKITVIEIDRRLTDYISKLSNEYGLEIEVLTRDISEPLPDNMLNEYDTFHTDPPEPLEAIRLFVGRGIAALTKSRGAGYVSLSLIDSSLYKWRDIQSILVSEFKVVITDVIRDFNVYQNWGYLEKMKIWRLLPVKQKTPEGWYRTSLIRIETLRESRGFNEAVREDIYTDTENISR